jgi:hypothetical protein
VAVAPLAAAPAPPPAAAAPQVAGVTAAAPAPAPALVNGAYQFALRSDLSLSLPQAALTSGTPAFSLQPLTSQPPPLPDGFQLQGDPFNLTLSGAAPPLALPATLTYHVPTSVDPARLSLARWNAADFVPLPCSPSASNTQLDCTLTAPAQYAFLLAPAPAPPLDQPATPTAHFFRQANGWSGAGSRGFLVADDPQAAFWSEFQRLGGVDRLGFPISNRFQFNGFWTQAFQKLTLQWRPDLNQAVPLNVLDELNQRGLDPWLDQFRQVPPALDTSADAALDWPAVQARHLALLDPFPELKTFYSTTPNALDTYGLPLAVKDYGAFVAVRLQRATFQLWPGNPTPSVVLGNAADLAKEVGLWPLDAITPTMPPAAAADAPTTAPAPEQPATVPAPDE